LLDNIIGNPDKKIVSPLPDSCFEGYNTNKTLELNNPVGGNSHFIPDSSGSQTGARVTVMQLNQYDVQGDSSDAVFKHLESILGTGMVSYLVAQAALDTGNQTATINDVIKTVFNNNKLVVYDRRFNDQLGSQ
jgi:hypothetical protein